MIGRLGFYRTVLFKYDTIASDSHLDETVPQHIFCHTRMWLAGIQEIFLL